MILSRSDRRQFLQTLGVTSMAAASSLVFPLLGRGGPLVEDFILEGRPLVRYPEKTDLILLTSRPPQLETPMHYFRKPLTPNEAFYVRYHIPPPTEVDLAVWRLKIGGHVREPMTLSMEDLQVRFERRRVIAVNQCSGNSRGRFVPRVLGGQWGDGAMGNAAWSGVSLADLLDRAGLREGARHITFNGLDKPSAPLVPDFVKSVTVDHVLNDPNVLIAYEMNDRPLPMLNGFPARLVVPGWYATYWVKNLSEIMVLDHEFDGFWMQKAYRIPATPSACMPPGTASRGTIPINRMNVRSFITMPREGERIGMGQPVVLTGIAFDGGYGISDVVISTDGGSSWRSAKLGPDLGNYSFREWSYDWIPSRAGRFQLMVRATNRMGESQPLEPLWNPAGYMRNVVERINVVVA